MTLSEGITLAGWGIAALGIIGCLLFKDLLDRERRKSADLGAQNEGLRAAIDGMALTARQRLDRINDLLRQLSSR